MAQLLDVNTSGIFPKMNNNEDEEPSRVLRRRQGRRILHQ